MESRTVVFAGGGTAGHIQPALAVALHWQKAHPSDRIIFLGTATGLETSLVPAAGFDLQLITRVRVPRSPSLGALKSPTQLLRSIADCRRILSGADLLIGFGGYVCAPAYIAAATRKIPIVIHEANAKPGWANRLGTLFTHSLAAGIPVAAGKFSEALITGIPLREDIAELLNENKGIDEQGWAEMQAHEKKKFGFDPKNPLLLVVGGSQGSQAINSVIEKTRMEINSHFISILHSVGGSNAVVVADENYKSVQYIREMARAYVAADLIIARSGAITCSEIRTIGKFAIFIPLAIGNGEQGVNALELVSQGNAVLIDQKSFTPQWLVDNIVAIMEKALNSAPSVDLSDLDATAKITALMEHALRNPKA
jgi:UDP-N-acetylglucosamine--N-acetylmuramyl-(pentapeptide) pyrophosphoryl-undecaprenol N-acetylglucosamine transferase